jgi:hypothetical protein
MPYVAKIKRDDPFRPEDERDIEAMCKRIAAASGYMALAGWREDAGYRVFHFGTWAKARAMQHWIDRSGIARRPIPKLGETAQERAEQQREALAWGLEIGAVHAVVQAYRQARDRGESELTAFTAAADAARGPTAGQDQRYGRRTDRLGRCSLASPWPNKLPTIPCKEFLPLLRSEAGCRLLSVQCLALGCEVRNPMRASKPNGGLQITMDATLEDKLVQAKANLAVWTEHLGRHRAYVAQLESKGLDTADARQDLRLIKAEREVVIAEVERLTAAIALRPMSGKAA